jgi:hypothetical protein
LGVRGFGGSGFGGSGVTGLVTSTSLVSGWVRYWFQATIIQAASKANKIKEKARSYSFNGAILEY